MFDIDFLTLGAVAMIVLGIGVFMLYYSVKIVSYEDVTLRVQEVVVESRVDEQLTITSIETRDLTGTIIDRLLIPAFRRLGNLIGRFMPGSAIEKTNRDLAIAGNPLRMGAREFYGLRVLFMIIGVALGILVLSRGIDTNGIGASLLLLLFMFLAPVSWLSKRVKNRRKSISKGLPDALDMLSVCASAGLGFDQSLQRLSAEWDTPISEEFSRMLSEMELGISRQEALRNMEMRLQISELSSFISIIIQSEKLGMSIAETLQAQAEQMRIDRRFKAQEIAQKMPAKMLFPLAFLILPAIMAVLLGPSVPVFIDLFFNVLS